MQTQTRTPNRLPVDFTNRDDDGLPTEIFSHYDGGQWATTRDATELDGKPGHSRHSEWRSR